MNDLDTALRSLYTGRADRAPSGHDLLDAVHDRARRDRRRRMIAAVLSVVLLAGAGGLGTALLLRPEENRTLRFADGTAVTRPGPAPIRVGWMPDGYGEQEVQYLGPDAWAIEVFREDPAAALAVQVMSHRPDDRTDGLLTRVGGSTYYWFQPGSGDTTDPSKSSGPFAELTYQRRPGQWIRIVGMSTADTWKRARADLDRVAASITDGTTPVVDTIRLALPAGTAWGRLLAADHHSPTGTVGLPEASTEALLVGAGTPSAAVGPYDLPYLHGAEPTTRLGVQIVDRGGAAVRNLPSEAARKPDGTVPPGTLPLTEIPPEGLLVTIRTTVAFVHPVEGDDRAAVIVRLRADDPLADLGTLRALAESVRLGPDARLGP